jgi:hypothetical protein
MMSTAASDQHPTAELNLACPALFIARQKSVIMTWGPELMLRDDAGTWDLGYPRTVQRADGKIVTVYYFNDAKDRERYIAATIWDAR